MLLLDEDSQLPLISFRFLLVMIGPPLSSSPDAKESLRSPDSVAGYSWTGLNLTSYDREGSFCETRETFDAYMSVT